MKNTLLVILFFFIISCNNKSKVENAIEEIPVALKVVRFDQDFFEAKPSELQKLKKQYPFFFDPGTPDDYWIEKMQNKDWRDLYQATQTKFKDFNTQKQEIETLFKHIKYYFPQVITPTVYTLISEVNPDTKAIYANDKLLIAIELYLGKDTKFYQPFPQYLKANFEPRQMMPDIAQSFAYGILKPPTDETLLSLMIYSGKELYLKDLLLPDYTDAEKIGYTQDQLKFCQENEQYIWTRFIEDKLLFSSESKLANRFINPAPFSKFYLEIDNQTPGRIGQFTGWQIVRSFVENNPEVALQDVLKLDAKQLFERSKYKPKK